MPDQKDIDRMMTGVDIEYDYADRVAWGDGVNAEYFDEWDYYVPSITRDNIGGRSNPTMG